MVRVLIVDDERTTVELLFKALNLFGYDPIMAFSGEEALEVTVAEQPDVVLLDLLMPGIDGYETLRRLRTMPEGKKLPIIVVTAVQEEGLEERVAQAGGDACLRKPVDLVALSATIATFVDHA